MAVEKNIGLMRRWFQEVWNEGNIETIHELLAPDAIAVGQLEDRKELRGAGAFVAFVKSLLESFPDMKIKVEDVFGSEDEVVVRWSSTMTHSKDHLGMPATGKEIRLTGITIARIQNEKIVAGWDSWDQLGMLKQIGAYVSPENRLTKIA
jgi:steroid delta-isomerase-like uncharacterized protein